MQTCVGWLLAIGNAQILTAHAQVSIQEQTHRDRWAVLCEFSQVFIGDGEDGLEVEAGELRTVPKQKNSG